MLTGLGSDLHGGLVFQELGLSPPQSRKTRQGLLTPARLSVHIHRASGLQALVIWGLQLGGPGRRSCPQPGCWPKAPHGCRDRVYNGCAPPPHPQLGPTPPAGLALPPAQGMLRAVTRLWPPPHILPTVGKICSLTTCTFKKLLCLGL